MAKASGSKKLSQAEIQFLLNRSSAESSDSELEYTSSDISYMPSDQDNSSNESTYSVSQLDNIRPPSPLLPPPLPDLQPVVDQNIIWNDDINLTIPFEFIGNPGIKCQIENIGDILDYVKTFIGLDFITLIKEETDNYAAQLLAILQQQNKLKKKSLLATWVETSTDELYVYFALVLLMGIIKKGRRRETRFQCIQCDGTALCVFPCFEIYHTQADYTVENLSEDSD